MEGGLNKFDDFAGEVSADGDAGDVEGDGASSKCSEIHRQVRIQKLQVSIKTHCSQKKVPKETTRWEIENAKMQFAKQNQEMKLASPNWFRYV